MNWGPSWKIWDTWFDHPNYTACFFSIQQGFPKIALHSNRILNPVEDASIWNQSQSGWKQIWFTLPSN